MKSVKSSFKSRKFKMGGYQTLIMVVVIVAIIILNLVVNKLNIQVDLSSDQKFTLTEQTKNYVKNLQDDITMYYMCEDGNQYEVIEKVLDQYKDFSKIEVVDKDPVIYPNFAKEYTDVEIKDNDVIVVDEKNGKSKLVSISDMYLQDIDYSTYSQTYTLDAEGQLTAAIENVTKGNSSTMYYTAGHGEAELESSFQDILKKSGVAAESLDTSKENKIPEDCNILMLHGPQYDISKEEYKVISEYLANGGKALFFLNPAASEALPNFYKVLSDYGVDVVDGYVVDDKLAMSPQYPTIILPTVAEGEPITNGTTDSAGVVLPVSKAMKAQSDVRSTLTITPLLSTSDSAFTKVDYKSSNLKKEDGDIAGPFGVAYSLVDNYTEKTQGTGKATEIVVYGAVSFTADDFTANNQYGNRTMLVNTVSFLTGGETSSLAIPTRSLDMQNVTVKEGDRVFFTVLLVVLLPLALLGCGFAIWFKRRKN